MAPGSKALETLAADVADGSVLDWDEALESLPASDLSLATELKTLSASLPRPADLRAAERRSRWAILLDALAWLAGVRVLAGALAAIAVEPKNPTNLLVALVFGISGAVVAAGARRDRRSLALAGVLLTVASSFATPLIRAAEAALRIPPLLGSAVAEAFVPAFLWLFVARFPDLPAFIRPQRWAHAGAAVAALAAAVLFAANLAAPAGFPWLAASVGRSDARSVFWAVVAGLSAAALVVAALKIPHASGVERARVRYFLAALFVGFAPMLAAVVLADARSPLEPWLERNREAVGVALYAFLLTIPASTTTALVERALGFRFAVRHVLEAVISPPALRAAVWAHAAVLAAHLYLQRAHTVGAWLAVAEPWLYSLGAVLTVKATRERILQAVDRILFRRRTSRTAAIADFASACAAVRSPRELEAALATALAATLEPRSVSLFLGGGKGRAFAAVSGRQRALPAGSALASILGASMEPFSVDWSDDRSLTRLLPREDQEWLSDEDYEVLLRVQSELGEGGAFLALGGRGSGEGYGRDDRLFLKTLAAAASAAVERLDAQVSPDGARGGLSEELASECARCGAVLAAGTTTPSCCPRPRLAPAALPLEPLGRYTLLRRLGKGGMGIVYLAVDTALDRQVALKTLPRLAPAAAARIRHEARAMAAVSHPHLATIHGAETWRGTPFLVLELVPKGTLRDRFHEGPLSISEVQSLARALLSVLDQLHGRGILHRDVKPSNIGIAADGTVKLLDFGVATLADPLVGPGTPAAEMAGTPAYMCPEAFAGAPPDPMFDLWSLNVVLIEAMTGRNPFHRETTPETRRAVMEGLPRSSPESPLHAAIEGGLQRSRAVRESALADLRRLVEQNTHPGETVARPSGPRTPERKTDAQDETTE